MDYETVEECGTVQIPICRPVPREHCEDVEEKVRSLSVDLSQGNTAKMLKRR